MWLTPGCSPESSSESGGGFRSVARSIARLSGLAIVDEHRDGEVGIELARGAQVIGEAINHHGGLLG